jgi:hypothetical protein
VLKVILKLDEPLTPELEEQLGRHIGELCDSIAAGLEATAPPPRLAMSTVLSAASVLVGEAIRQRFDLCDEEIQGFMTHLGQSLQDLVRETIEIRSRRGGLRTCRSCGCTDLQACVVEGVPCSWVEADLCSACAGLLHSTC